MCVCARVRERYVLYKMVGVGAAENQKWFMTKQ